MSVLNVSLISAGDFKNLSSFNVSVGVLKDGNFSHLLDDEPVNESTNTQVSFIQSGEEDGVIYFYWQSIVESTFGYNVSLGVVNDGGTNFEIFAEGAWVKEAFAMQGYNNVYGFATSLLLQYGSNYEDDSEYFSENAWNLCVNEDYTLRPGVYAVFVGGVDNEFNVTEDYNFVVVEVKGTTSGNETGIYDISNKNVMKKYVDHNGYMFIQLNNNIYDCQGRKLK